ncbi:MAG: multidrug efflux SMR transporter [Planifilum fulgidum]
MSWICLVLAGLTEVAGVVGLKKVSEKGSWFTYLLMIGGFLVSLTLLRVSLEAIPLSIAYAVWTGIGTTGAAVVGILFFHESKSPGRILCMLGIIACIIGLRWIA